MKPAVIFFAAVLLCAPLSDHAQAAVKGDGGSGAAGREQICSKAENILRIGSRAPEITLESLMEDTMRLSQVKSNLLLLDFWTSYCSTCQVEYQSTLLPLYYKYYHQGFQVFAVSFDTDAAKWLQAIEENKYAWIQVADFGGISGSAIARRYQIEAIPTNYLLDENGFILAKNLRGKQLESFVEQYLEGK